MNTILVQVSKDKAKVQNENGRFMNEVSQGIVINTGDKISLEGIAVNSTGVGSNIIEIPSKIKNFDYKTNTIAIKFNPYIHHNNEFTCSLPTNFTSTYTDNTLPTFGYCSRAVPPSRINLNIASPSNKTKTKLQEFDVNLGDRYYLMGCNIDDTTNAFEEGYLPTQALWKAQEMVIQVEVPIGYDSPQNIASKITEQLHKVIPSPFPRQGVNNANVSFGVVGENSVPALLYTTGDTMPGYNQFLSTGGVASGGAVVQTRRVNSSSINQATPPNVDNDNNSWYACFAAQNPKLWEYGSELLKDGIKNMTFVNEDVAGVAHPAGKLDQVYFIGEVPIVGGNSVIPDNYVFTTNLDYNFLNLSGVAAFIHSQKQYIGAAATTKTMKESDNHISFESLFSLGRYNDDANDSAVAGNVNKIVPACWVSTGVDYTASANATQIKCYTYFIQSKFDAINQQQNDIQSYGFEINYSEAPKILCNGNLFAAENVCKFFNCMLVPVRTSPTYVSPAGATEWSIGIVMKENNLGAVNSISPRNYCMFDMSFYSPLNRCVQLYNTNYINRFVASPAVIDGTVADNYTKIIQVGAPNAALTFDGDKGRFGWSNLHWAMRVGSGTLDTATAAAANICVKMNVVVDKFFSVGLNANQLKPFNKYAHSGIGFNDFGLVKEESNGNQTIEWFEGEYYYGDYEPANWKECLMGRLGFLYSDLITKYGYTNSVFKEGTYNTEIPTTYVDDFPSPLTTNPAFTSSLALGLSVNIHNFPMFDLGVQNNIFNVVLSSETALIFARNLPNKLVFPYWLIYSDIIEGIEFHSVEDGERNNIIAVCNRAYISGDFAMSFATDYVFTATRDYVITGITTQILNPDLTPADIDDKTTVIYKIQKPIPMFNQSIENLPTKRDAVAPGKQTEGKT